MYYYSMDYPVLIPLTETSYLILPCVFVTFQTLSPIAPINTHSLATPNQGVGSITLKNHKVTSLFDFCSSIGQTRRSWTVLTLNQIQIHKQIYYH